MISYTVIIPQRNSIDTLPRLLNSIPEREDIEVILIDNGSKPISKEDIKGVSRDYKLLWSSPDRFAGGARNVGLENAHGEWLIFADADDFFTPNAFDAFDSHKDGVEELVYFKSESVYDDTLEPSDRHLLFNSYIDKFLSGKSDELGTKLAYLVPWGKMIKRELIENNRIRFDEVLAANDVYFSTLVGYYSHTFTVDDSVVYVITTRRASLANRRDLPVIKSRYMVALRRNDFLKQHDLGKRQGSVMIYIYQASRYGLKELCWFLKQAAKFRQNIFIGMSNWFKTYRLQIKNSTKNKAYITK